MDSISKEKFTRSFHNKNVGKLTLTLKSCLEYIVLYLVTAPQSCHDEVLQIIPTVIENVNDSAEVCEDVFEPSSTQPSELCRTRCVENSPRAMLKELPQCDPHPCEPPDQEIQPLDKLMTVTVTEASAEKHTREMAIRETTSGKPLGKVPAREHSFGETTRECTIGETTGELTVGETTKECIVGKPT
ncbi:hypothetical protein CHUAL_009554 [Chamberlinius hualienensis]